MRHPRYCLTHHPGISSNITNATHFSTPPNVSAPTLYPRWPTTHASNAGTSPKHATYVTHASASSTLVRHPRQHASNANTPITLACLPRHSRQQKQHIISQTPRYPIKLLNLLALKFQEEIQQFLLLVFIFTASTFQVFLSILIEVWKTAIEKFRGNQSALFKTELFFQKQI